MISFGNGGSITLNGGKMDCAVLNNIQTFTQRWGKFIQVSYTGTTTPPTVNIKVNESDRETFVKEWNLDLRGWKLCLLT